MCSRLTFKICLIFVIIGVLVFQTNSINEPNDCLRVCDGVYRPVCDKDGWEYENMCEFQLAKCDMPCTYSLIMNLTGCVSIDTFLQKKTKSEKTKCFVDPLILSFLLSFKLTNKTQYLHPLSKVKESVPCPKYGHQFYNYYLCNCKKLKLQEKVCVSHIIQKSADRLAKYIRGASKGICQIVTGNEFWIYA